MGTFMFQIRHQGFLVAYETCYILTDTGVLVQSPTTLGEIDSQYRDPDGFLYLKVEKENVFGVRDPPSLTPHMDLP